MKTALLAAGFGSRLWPLSTSEKPKQFQQLLGEQSLLQYTYEFFRVFTPDNELFVLTLDGLEHWVYEQLPDMSEANVLVVPERRNTLPHTLFALNALAESPEEKIIFSGVDTFLIDQSAVSASLKDIGKQDARTIELMLSVDSAIDPSCGYAQLDEQQRVVKFYEKPDAQTIKKESGSGSFYKSLFIYATSPAGLKLALDSIDSDTATLSRKLLLAASEKERHAALLAMPLCDISSTAFQHAPNIVGRLTDSDSIDLGKFRTLHQVNKKDQRGNVIFGNVLLEKDCTDNFVVNQLDQPLVLIGIHDSVIIQTLDGSLVSPINQADRVGEVYKQKIHTSTPSQQR